MSRAGVVLDGEGRNGQGGVLGQEGQQGVGRAELGGSVGVLGSR